MPRVPRSNLEPGWFHCINRGVNRETLFFDDDDYRSFSELAIGYSALLNLKIGAYCLMPNHWHIALECTEISNMSEFFRYILNQHTKSHRAKYRRIGYGPIYQGRYKSLRVKDESALSAVCEYIENNPVRAHLVRQAHMWRWSSASNGDSQDRIGD